MQHIGVYSVSEVRRLLINYIENDLFCGESPPSLSRRHFYPTDSDIRSILNTSQIGKRKANDDQSNLEIKYLQLVNISADEDGDQSEEDGDQSEEDFNEEEVISYYFYPEYQYAEIIQFRERYHHFKVSCSTLLRRLKQFGLRRRFDRNSNTFHNTIITARQRIEKMLNGPESLSGYRSIWHTLEMEGTRIPRSVVEAMLREIDREGTALRRKDQLRRREYVNPGQTFLWHIDGYDKLKPWGFPIHGCIDRYSRKVIWLNVTRLNSSPDTIAKMYLNSVEELDGCPRNLITNLGTENVIVAGIQCFLCDNLESHSYVTSPPNQRID
eukprot:gene13091-14432_t